MVHIIANSLNEMNFDTEIFALTLLPENTSIDCQLN